MSDTAGVNAEALVQAAAERYGMVLDHTDLGAVGAIVRRTSAATAALVQAVEQAPLPVTDSQPTPEAR